MNRLLRRLLAWCTRPEDRPFLFEDLDEEVRARVVAGDPDAHRWYRDQLLGSIWPSLRRRLASRRGRTRVPPSTASIPDTLRIEFRHAVRAWMRNPGLAVATLVALALGIGIPTTMYSIVRGALRDLPVERGEDVMVLGWAHVRRGATGQRATRHDLADWRAQQTAFEDLAAFTRDRVNLSDDRARPERVSAAAITPNAFALLGVPALRGRAFTPGDADAGADVALISHTLWLRRFGADSAVLGRMIRINGAAHEIIGVMPPGFAFPGREQLWTPLAVSPAGPRSESGDLVVFGRLEAGTGLTRARAEFDAISDRLALAWPQTNADRRATITPYTEAIFGGEMAPILYTMFAVVSTVLLIACANVANLLTAQAMHRRRELAIRSALGAGRGRLLSQFVLQTTIVAAAGAAIGVGIAWLGTYLFNRGMGAGPPTLYWIDVRVDTATLVFALAAAGVASALPAIIPVRLAWRGDVQATLQREGRGTSGFRAGRLSGSLVVAEVAFSCVLLTIAGLMIKGLARTSQIDPPFAAERTLVGEIEFTDRQLTEVEERLRLTDALRERLEAAPGVRAVSFASSAPGLSGDPLPVALLEEVAAPDRPTRNARRVVVSPGFFAGLEGEVAEGRGFGPQDRAGAEPVAIVNRSFARRFFPDGSPLGARLRFGPEDWGLETRTVIGVVPDLLAENVSDGRAVPEGVYVPMAQADQRSTYMLVHVRSDPAALLPALREAMAEVDPNLPWADPQPLDQAMAASVQIFRVFGRLFTAFGLVALFLASVGLHGITSFAVGRRLREIAVRVALGANPRNVAGLVLGGTLKYVAIGACLGVGVSLAVTPVLREGFLGVGSRDPAVLGGIVLTLAAVAMAAAAGPLRRARRVDPMTVLKID